MIKIVYVFTGTEKPAYLNMLRISVASVEKQTPDMKIEILTDSDTGEYLLSNHIFDNENVSVVSAETPEGYSVVEKSRYLKTNLRQLVTGDFLYIDSDTIVCADLSGIEPKESVSMVLDAHCLFEEQEWSSRIRRKAQELGIDLSGCVRYYNGGVILAKDDEKARELFRRWYEKWENTRKPGMHQDQFSLNAVNIETNLISELDGVFNCQLTANDRAFSYLRNVKILHYLSAQRNGIYRLNDIELLESDLTDDDINDIITYPEKQFCPFHFYSDDSPEYQVMQGALFHLAYRWYLNHRKLYNFFEKVLSKLRK